MENLLVIPLFLVLTYVSLYYFKYFTRISPLPGPFPLPIFGNIFELIRTNGDFGKLTKILHKKYGDMWEFYLFSDRQIWLSRGDLIDKLLSKKFSKTHYFQKLPKNPGLDEIQWESFGLLGIRDYEKWRMNRKFLVQALSTTKFINSLIPITRSAFAKMENYWSQLDPTKPIDLIQWGSRFTSDIIFKVSTHRDLKLMAEYFNSLVSDELKVPIGVPGQHRFESDLVKDILGSTPNIFFLMMFPPWVRRYVPGFKQKNKTIIEKMNNRYRMVEREIVKKRKAEIENTPIGQELPNDLLTQFCVVNTSRSDVRIENANGKCEPMTDYEIGRVMDDVFLAGTDSTAHTLCYNVHYLCKYPRVKDRVLEEINSVLGSNFGEHVTNEQLEKLVYLDAVIKEVSRLSPIINAVVRDAELESEIGGYIWPAGTVLHADLLNISLHPSHWTNPEEFIPERWLKTNDKDNKLSKLFLQFGGGVRDCPGKLLSTTELKIMIVLLFMNYEVRLADESGELKTFTDLLINRCLELNVFLKPKKV